MWIPGFLKPLKPPLKRARHRARSAYINRFYSFTPADFREKLRPRVPELYLSSPIGYDHDIGPSDHGSLPFPEEFAKAGW